MWVHRIIHQLARGKIDGPQQEKPNPLVDPKRSAVVRLILARIAEVPREAVEVPKDMTAGTGRIAVAGRKRRIVEQRPPRHDMLGLRVEHRDMADLGAGRRIDDRDGIIEAGQHVQAAVPSSSTTPLGPPPETGICCAVLGIKVSCSSSSV